MNPRGRVTSKDLDQRLCRKESPKNLQPKQFVTVQCRKKSVMNRMTTCAAWKTLNSTEKNSLTEGCVCCNEDERSQRAWRRRNSLVDTEGAWVLKNFDETVRFKFERRMDTRGNRLHGITDLEELTSSGQLIGHVITQNKWVTGDPLQPDSRGRTDKEENQPDVPECEVEERRRAKCSKNRVRVGEEK